MSAKYEGYYYYNTYKSMSSATRVGQLLEKGGYDIRMEIVKEYKEPIYRLYTNPEISQSHRLKMQIRDARELGKLLEE